MTWPTDPRATAFAPAPGRGAASQGAPWAAMFASRFLYQHVANELREQLLPALFHMRWHAAI
jgi:hypothetical protein